MDKISVLSWNVRGARDATHRQNVKKLISTSNPTVLCLQETKCVSWSYSMKSSIWSVKDHGWIETPAIGLSGGLLVFWDLALIDYQSHVVNRNFILFTGKLVNSGTTFSYFNVYAPRNLSLKGIYGSLCVIYIIQFQGFQPCSLATLIVLDNKQNEQIVFTAKETLRILTIS